MKFHNRTQPPDGAIFDFSHPLAKGIVTFIAPLSSGRSIRNWADRTNPTFYSFSNINSSCGLGRRGIGINWNNINNDNNIDLGNIPTDFGSTKAYTFLVWHNRIANNNAISLYRRKSSGANPVTELYIANNSNGNRLTFSFNFDAVTVTGNYVYPVSNDLFMSVGVHDELAGVKLYTNGVLDATGSEGQTWSLSGTSGTHNVGSPNGGSGAQGHYLIAASWNRALTADEIMQLYLNPWILLDREVRNQRFLPTSPLSFTEADSINNLADSVALSNGAAANYGVTAGDQLSLADAISLVGPPPDYKILLGDAFSNLQDSARTVIGLREQLTDSINNLVDAFSKMMGIPLSVFDSQQFNWADAIATSFGAPLSVSKSDSLNNFLDAVTVTRNNVKISLTFSDTINHLADALRIWAILRIATGDNLDFSDSLMTRFNHLMRIAELLPSWLDSPLLARSSKPAFSDSVNNLNDSVSIALTVNLRLSKGDTVNLLSDSVSLLLSTSYNLSDIQRIRRYLGDTQSS